jgi:hypothetical protein
VNTRHLGAAVARLRAEGHAILYSAPHGNHTVTLRVRIPLTDTEHQAVERARAPHWPRILT